MGAWNFSTHSTILFWISQLTPTSLNSSIIFWWRSGRRGTRSQSRSYIFWICSSIKVCAKSSGVTVRSQDKPAPMFVINASEVAALVGLNPYKDQDEAIRDCYNRNIHGLAPEEKRRAEAICKSDHRVARAMTNLEKSARATKTTKEVGEIKQKFVEQIDDIKKVNTEKIEKKLDDTNSMLDEKYEKKIADARTRSQKKLLEDERDALKGMAKLEKEKMTEKLEKDLGHMKNYSQRVSNTNFGTRKEESVADMYKAHTGRAIHKTNKSHYLEIIPGKVKICGRFDGFNDDDVLIEIKNRMRRIFGRVVDYERVQIHVYMAMAQTERSQLVERYKEKIMIHEVDYDEDFMDGILDELKDISTEKFIDA